MARWQAQLPFCSTSSSRSPQCVWTSPVFKLLTHVSNGLYSASPTTAVTHRSLTFPVYKDEFTIFNFSKCFTSSSLDSVNGDTIHLDANVIKITITVFLIWVTDVDRITRTPNLIGTSLPNNSISSRKVIQKAERTPEGS